MNISLNYRDLHHIWAYSSLFGLISIILGVISLYLCDFLFNSCNFFLTAYYARDFFIQPLVERISFSWGDFIVNISTLQLGICKYYYLLVLAYSGANFLLCV